MKANGFNSAEELIGQIRKYDTGFRRIYQVEFKNYNSQSQ